MDDRDEWIDPFRGYKCDSIIKDALLRLVMSKEAGLFCQEGFLPVAGDPGSHPSFFAVDSLVQRVDFLA